jgi:hypothetical protein
VSGRLLWLPAALRDCGLKVDTVAGWETRGRPTMHPRAGIWHHTAAPLGRNAPSLRVVIDGRSDLPGPLCHVLVGRDLTCHIIASGLAHHGGTGGWRGVSGNASVVGVECENNGVDEPWSTGMVDVMVRIAAACCNAVGFGAEMWCGHKEWAPRRKVDPWGLSCNDLRRRTAALLTPPIAAPQEDPEMVDDIIGLHRVYLGAAADPAKWEPAMVASFDHHYAHALAGRPMGDIRKDFATTAKQGKRL